MLGCGGWVSHAVGQKTNREGFVKPGELVEVRAAAGLSLHDRRGFNLLIDNAWPEIGEDKEHRIAIAKVRGPRHESGDRVAESVSRLMTTLVEIPTMLNGQAAVLKIQLLVATTPVIPEHNPNAALVS